MKEEKITKERGRGRVIVDLSQLTFDQRVEAFIQNIRLRHLVLHLKVEVKV